MAQGFRDCCNEFSYFTLTQIPATVSEFETYYIRTTQGLTFCATYVNIPPINYELPQFSALEITQQTNCDSCVSLYPCTTDEAIILEQFGEGSIVSTYDCNFSTVLPMNVDCLPVNPTFNNTNDGQVIVSTTGGLPPYTFTINNTQVVNYTRIDNRYILLPNATVGTYNITITDSNGDFVIPLQCTLNAPPPPPIVECNTTDATFFGKPDGLLDFTIIEGTPPFTFYLNGIPIELPYQIGAGTYTIFFTDQYYQDSIECTIGQPPEVQYPDVLCMTFILSINAIGCTQPVSLNFYKEITKYNYRAWYTCSNSFIAGLSNFDLKWEEELCIQTCGPVEPGWYVSGDFSGNIQWNVDCLFAIPITGNRTAFKKLSPTPTPLDEQPAGAWTTVYSDFAATNIIVTENVCPPVARVLSTTDFCGSASPTQGSALAAAEGGSGPPYAFTVRYTDGQPYINYSPGSVILTNLFAQQYLLTVTDSQGNESLPVPFTINFNRGFLFDTTTINPCATYNYSTSWLNGFVNPFGQAYIEPGEAFVDTISTFSQFNFTALPNGFELNARLVLDIIYTVTVGQEGYNDPNVLFSYLPNTVFNTFQVTTNLVPTNVMSGIIPIDVVQPFTLFGNWYRISNGNSCCGNPLTEGVTYSRNLRYESNFFTITNTTLINTSITTQLINSIPFYEGVISRICPRPNFCGGQVTITFKLNLKDIRRTAGCGDSNITERNIYSYRFSNGSASPFASTWNTLPTPACSGGGK
jgi:hypothetical protein